MTINELRERAASLGLSIDGMDRFQLLQALAQVDAEVEELRQECASRGLASHGSKGDLELRLTEQRSGLTSRDRQVYRATAYAVLGLGLVGLAVSVPHVAAGLARLVGMGGWYGYLLAVVIDGGICCLKVVDTLSHKFDLRSARKVASALMVACLGLSAAINGSEFVLNVASPFGVALAWATAVFLSGFVFSMFYTGSSMLLREAPKTTEEPSGPEALVNAAEQFERLAGLAKAASAK